MTSTRLANWGVRVGLVFVANGCGGASKEAEAPGDDDCEFASGPTSEPGRMWCMLSCSSPRVTATCNGPPGRPVACKCGTGPKEGATFALDRCQSLEGEIVRRRCGAG